MKRLVSTLALLLVLVGLGSYIYFTGAPPIETSTKQDKLFPDLDAAKIDELTVKSENGDVTTTKKSGAAWTITSPISAPGAEVETMAVANLLADVEIARVLEEAPANLDEYGLNAPRLSVGFKAEGGKNGTLLIGAKTPSGGNVYAKRDDETRVVLIAQYHESTINKSTFDLRDKTIVKFDRAKVDTLTLNFGGKVSEFKKNGEVWTMTKPVAARADSPAIEGMLARLETMQMKSVVSTNPSDASLKQYTLDRPESTVTLGMGADSLTLSLGGAADEMSAYLRASNRPDVVLIETASADDLKKPGEDYRNKELFEMRAFNATRVEFIRGGQTTVIERVKATEEGQPDTWKRVTPNEGVADREKTELLLAGTADIRAVSFAGSKAGTGLDAPVLTVVARFDDGKKEERVTFGKRGDNAFAARPDEPDAMRIDASKLEDTLKALDEISK